MRRLLALLVALALAVAGAACSDDDAQGADPSSTTAQTTAGGDDDGADGEDGGEVPDPEGVTVELLDPGTKPRRVLRLDPEDDCESRARQNQVQSISIDLQGETQSLDQEIEIDIAYRCQEVTEDRIEMQLEYEDARLVSSQAGTEDALTDALESMVGAVGKATYDRRGSLLALTTPVPDLEGAAREAAEQAAESVEDQASQLSSTLPAEAVGVGARWTVASEGVLSGLPFEQVTTFTITSIEGDVVEADTETAMTFPPGPMQLPGAGQADIREGHMAGTGTVTWDLRQVVPLSTSIVEGDVVALISTNDGEVELREHIRTEQRIVAR